VDKVFTDPIAYEVPLSAPAKDQERLYNLKQKLMKDQRASRGVGSPTKTNVLLYNRIMSKTPEEFQKTDMTSPEIVNGLSEADYKQVVRLQRKGREEFTNVQGRVAYVNSLVKEEELEDFDKASFFRASFENELNKYPPEQRNRIETWNKVRDQLLLEVNVEENWFFDEKYWEARYQGKTIAAPSEKPTQVPKDSKWVDKMVNNQPVRGWQYTNAQGITFLYSTDGNIYRGN